MKNLCVKNISVIYPGKTVGERVHALDNINLTINNGDFVVALGASTLTRRSGLPQYFLLQVL